MFCVTPCVAVLIPSCTPFRDYFETVVISDTVIRFWRIVDLPDKLIQLLNKPYRLSELLLQSDDIILVGPEEPNL